ncbi:unnamed protein product [Gemmata massiliana]|uniref:HNH endonuclease n=1 Tax=Gemmata massiliana TaxID=1210884 RepID=A0A6P2CZT9_9BACT|nr:unnamed protein product [Gemmata massiliana]
MPERMPKAKPLTERKRERPTAWNRGYGRMHQDLRRELLATFPVCQHCQTEFSQHAHHLRYPALSLSDYLALCESCHGRLHAKQDR